MITTLNTLEFSLRILAGRLSTREAFFELGSFIWTAISLVETSQNSNLLVLLTFSLILQILGWASNFLTALSTESIMPSVRRKAESLIEVSTPYVVVTKWLLKISAIFESLCIILPCSIGVKDEFTWTLSENIGLKVF